MNRGDHREAIFRSTKDREAFLQTLGQACQKTDWQIHAWCLMRNHFHLVIETPRANLVPGMKWLLGTYTMRFNHRHRLFGHLFSGRYKALPVDGSGSGYLKSVCDYVHLNPARAKLVAAKAKLSEFRWSSYPEYLKVAGSRRPWLRVDGCWASTSSPRTARRAAESLSGAWNGGERARTVRDLRHCNGDGLWGARNFAKNCWLR